MSSSSSAYDAALLADSWSAAAPGYDDIFVRQFAPWTRSSLDALASRIARAERLVDGDVWVPCCGPGQELPRLHALLTKHAGPRRIRGVDLSAGMVQLAADKAKLLGPHVTAEVGDAMDAGGASYAVIFTVFGLQQMPDPALAMHRWVQALAPGGVLVVCFWPSTVEQDGPWAQFRALLAARSAVAAPPPSSAASMAQTCWESTLHHVCQDAGGRVEEDTLLAHTMRWESGALFWEAMTRHGPWEALARRKGRDFVDSLRDDLFQLYPPASAVEHRPQARLLVVSRADGPCCPDSIH